MATRVAPFFARKKPWSVLGPMLNVSLWNSRLVHLCEIFSFSVSRDDGSWRKDLFIIYFSSESELETLVFQKQTTLTIKKVIDL